MLPFLEWRGNLEMMRAVKDSLPTPCEGGVKSTRAVGEQLGHPQQGGVGGKSTDCSRCYG